MADINRELQGEIERAAEETGIQCRFFDFAYGLGHHGYEWALRALPGRSNGRWRLSLEGTGRTAREATDELLRKFREWEAS